MLFFVNDYGEGAHPKVIKALTRSNMEQVVGYGEDKFSLSARTKIGRTFGVRKQDVALLTGGTQTNTIVIDSLVKPYEGVISCVTGHINAHEAGAVEAFGHKVLPIEGKDGKIEASTLAKYLKTTFTNPTFEHCVIPGMVYISFPTEYGTLYSKKELEDLYNVCKEYKLPLFIDGARLGYGLASKENDIAIKDLKNLCDVFYIGGTKVGALCGEAVVFTKKNKPEHFVSIVKRHGALVAKGRLLGVQFDALFTNDLYFKIAENAIECASVLRNALIKKGYKLFIDSPTNQLFPILTKEKEEELKKVVGFEFWENYDEDHDVIRFVTSWATDMENVNKLINLL